MDISALPSFPPPLPSRADREPSRRGWRPTLQQWHILRDLVGSACILAALVWLRGIALDAQQPSALDAQEPSAADPPPFDFQRIVRDFRGVHLFVKEAEVRALLGLPTRGVGWGGSMAAWEEKAEWSNRHFGIPRDRVWLVWADPADDRWVAVLIAGGEVYGLARQGVTTDPPEP